MMDATHLPLDLAALLALAAGLGWASGLRLYTTLFVVGVAGRLGWIVLPEGLRLLEHPWVLGAAGFMLFVEFFADKIPGVDSGWDLLHTLLRVPAGAFLAAAALSPDTGGQLSAGMLATGAGVALTSHLLKAGSRALLNTSPEPVSNWTASAAEDVVVVGALGLVWAYPWAALAIVLGIGVVVALALWWVWRKLFRRAPRPATG